MSSSTFAPDHPILNTPAIWHADAPRDGYAVVLMRRAVTLDVPRTIRVRVSASQRFILYLDGELVARGPSRSDPLRWNCSAVALRFPAGRHVLAAEVFHRGDQHGGSGQMGGPGFFLLAAETPRDNHLVSTADGWRVWHDRSRTPLPDHEWPQGRPLFVIGSGDRFDAAQHPWGWHELGFDDSSWAAPTVVCSAARDDWGNFPLRHALRPDPIPQMEERIERFARVADGRADVLQNAADWIAHDRPLVVPPNSELRLVLDRGELTNAYPQLLVSGGRGASIRMVGNEAPFIDSTRAKGDRDQIAGMHLWGFLDEFFPDGGPSRLFTTFWFRSFRYKVLTIRTAEQALTLDRFTLLGTAFPLHRKARFEVDPSARATQAKLDEISFRTIRLCAHETFFDCPHYEQLQFPGDSRVQAIYHYLVCDEDRLARKAIGDFAASLVPEGLLQCHFPCRRVQLISTFSLYWIGMLHDFRVYRGDADFLRQFVPMSRAILNWFERRIRPDGMLGLIDHAPFVDWTPTFKCGNAPQERDGGSSLLTLLLSCACRWQAGLERSAGFPELSSRYRRRASSLAHAAVANCWDAKRGLLADTPAKKTFSMHGQIQAILAGAWSPSRSRKILHHAMNDADIAHPGTLYFRFYLAQALRACGMRDRWSALQADWERLLVGTGLTTWPETDRNPRSDCHAWSVTPTIEFVHTILGIEPDESADGFARATLRPTPGNLQRASGTVPTPHGPIRIALRSTPRGIEAKLQSPIPLIVPSLGRTLTPGDRRIVIR